MVRSLWSAASGMTAQQTNVDVIANNLANVNTVGFKNQSAQFKSLLYQTIQQKTTSANGETKPIGAQVGLGTRNNSITTNFTQGGLSATGLDTDFGIDGQGFFTVQGDDGGIYYTRNGHFSWALADEEGTSIMLATSEGYPVLDTDGAPIILSADILGEGFTSAKISIDAAGRICYPDETGNPMPVGMQMGLTQFSNASGLEKTSDSLYKETPASGAPLAESENENLRKSTIRQSYLEMSNVAVVDEMVNLIVAQRAYEMNSKAIQAADQMMQQANNLRS